MRDIPVLPGVAGTFATVTFAFALALAGTSTAQAQRPTLDAVDVQRVDDEVVGIRDGSPATHSRLQKGERIRWMDAQGIVGAVLTDERLLAVSSTSAGWQEVRLGRDDGMPYVELGANILLCITPQRILAFLGPAGIVSEERLSPGETVLASGANEYVASVVTNRRVIGYSSNLRDGVDTRFRVREAFQSLKTLASTATVRTTERLLLFRWSSGSWTDEQP